MQIIYTYLPSDVRFIFPKGAKPEYAAALLPVNQLSPAYICEQTPYFYASTNNIAMKFNAFFRFGKFQEN